MDAATLRIILLVLGSLLLVAMYLWERRRSQERAERRFRRVRRRPPAPAARREPRFDAAAGDDAEPGGGVAEPPARVRSRAETESAEHGANDTAAVDAGARKRSGNGRESDRAFEPSPGRSQPSNTPSQPPPPGVSDDEPLLVQLFVVAVDGAFDGGAVQAAAERQHLVPGERRIYHRLTGDGAQSQYSMANLVEPGTFPFDAMDTFTTPGLALFAQFDGRTSDLMVYDELVRTARELADALGGEVRLPGRILFDDTAREFLRGELLSLIDERANGLAPGMRRGEPEPASQRREVPGERDGSAFEGSPPSQRP